MTTETTISYCFYTLLILYPFFPLIKEKYSSIGNLIELVLVILLFFGSIFYFENKKIKGVIIKNIAPLLFFVLIYAVLNFDDYYDSFSAIRMYLLYIAIIQLFIVRPNIVNRPRIVKIAMIICAIMGIGAIIQFIFPTIITNLHTADSLIDLRSKTDFKAFSIYNRAISFMLDPNILSIYFCFNMIFFAQYFHQRKKSKFFIITMMISLIGCALTQSRTGLFTIILFALMQFIRWMITIHKINIFGYILFFVSLTILFFFVINNISLILSFIRADTILTANGRVGNSHVMLGKLTQQDIFHLMFGNGLTVGREIVFENSFLLVFYSFGIIGLIIFLICASYVLRPIVNSSNWIAIISYLLVNLVGDYLLIPQITLYFLLGLAISSQVEKA